MSLEPAGVSAEQAAAMYDGHDDSIMMTGPSSPGGRVFIDEFYGRAAGPEEAVEAATAFVRRPVPQAEIVSIRPHGLRSAVVGPQLPAITVFCLLLITEIPQGGSG